MRAGWIPEKEKEMSGRDLEREREENESSICHTYHINHLLEEHLNPSLVLSVLT